MDLLLKAPWWISVVFGAISYFGLRFILPGMLVQNPILKGFAPAAPSFANYAAFLFGVTAVGSAIHGWRRRGLVEQQDSLETLRATSWKDFEYLVAEAYRRQGFAVDFSFNKGADGGVDLVLRKAGHTSLVQCKQWKIYSVGAPVVREMFGILKAGQADELIIVTSGKFTQEAQTFAEGKPIRLVDGPMLLELVRSVQTKERQAFNPPPVAAPERVSIPFATPKCPQCGTDMVERTARRGDNAGQKFWGCRKYPQCKGTRPLLNISEAG